MKEVFNPSKFDIADYNVRGKVYTIPSHGIVIMDKESAYYIKEQISFLQVKDCEQEIVPIAEDVATVALVEEEDPILKRIEEKRKMAEEKKRLSLSHKK
jgi:hypothetical protein